jgi:hypothetical protein
VKRTNKVLPSINPFKQTDKTKNRFQNATDTLTEVIVLFILVVVLAGGLFALFEGKDFLTGVWWAIVTGFTVGYGDIAPATMGGRAVGIGLMTFSTWVVLPLIIVLFIKKHSPDRNEFTDEEQKEILRLLRSLDSKKEFYGVDLAQGKDKSVKKTIRRK